MLVNGVDFSASWSSWNGEEGRDASFFWWRISLPRQNGGMDGRRRRRESQRQERVRRRRS